MIVTSAVLVIMEHISRAMTRIEHLRDQLNVPDRSGAFQSILDTATGSSELARPGSRPAAALSHDHGSMFGPNGVVPVALSGTDPADMDSYLQANGIADRNGRLTSAELVDVSGGWHGSARLLLPAAESWESMRVAAAADGVELLAIDTYRSYDTQAHAHEEYLAGRKPAYVAPPGRSEHGYGLAIDVTNGHLVGPGDREWEWLNANGNRFGWHPISNESWHWEYRG